MALGRALVVVYRRAAVRAVVAAFPALLLACCYRVTCNLLAVALMVAGILALLVALAWPAGGGGVADGAGLLLACWP